MADCTRCGTQIKNVFEYKGLPYGCECVQIVSGLKSWELPDGGNVDEYIARKEQRKAEGIVKALDTQSKREYYYEKNSWLIDYLMEKDCMVRNLTKKSTGEPFQVKLQQNGFCYSIAQDLFYKEIKDLSDKPFGIVIDMWAVDHGGKRNSKKYDKAYEEFFDKAGIE